jgi:stringent starvation protein B
MIRALHEWCTDNGYTPYLAVTVDAQTVVPREHVRDGQIVLNVSPLATHKLSLGNEYIEFQARFSGATRQISVPVKAVRAIYARESGQGMAFDALDEEEGNEHATAHDGQDTLGLDSPAVDDMPTASEPASAPSAPPALSSVPTDDSGTKPDDTPPSGGGPRPRLTVVK